MNRRQRVVHVLGSLDVGGTELNAVRVLQRLDRDRFELSIVTFAAHGELLAQLDALGLPRTALPVRGLWRLSTWRQLVRLYRHLRSLRADVVHAHEIYSNILAVPVARLAGVPLVIASRRWWTATNRWILRPLNRLAYAFAHRILTNAPSISRMVVETHRIPAARVVTVPNFIEPAAFEAPTPQEREAMARRLGLDGSGPVIGCVANLRAIKGHLDLVDAFALVKREHPTARLLLVGEGPERAAIEARARTLGVESDVILAGRQPSRPSPHWLCDVSVLASHGEAFPNAVLEALACGNAVVATQVGGIPDVVDDGRTGLLVPARDPARLGAAICGLLNGPERRRALGTAGRTVTLTDYHERAVLARLEGLYTSGV